MHLEMKRVELENNQSEWGKIDPDLEWWYLPQFFDDSRSFYLS